MVPLTDAYALRGVARHGLNYGPLRLWGSAAFVAGALGCGLLVDVIAAQNLIWVIASVAALGAFVGLGLQPLGTPKPVANIHHGAGALLRDPGFLAIIVTSAPHSRQPRRLLHLRFHRLAASRSRRADHCRALVIGGDSRDRGVCAVAALYAAAGHAGGDRRIERGRALGDHGAGTADRDPGCRSTGAWPDLRADAGRHHDVAGRLCARSCDGARAGLSRGLQRHCFEQRVDLVGRDLCPIRAGRLLRDGGDGAVRRCGDVAGAAPAGGFTPKVRRPADRPGCRRNATRRRGRVPAARGHRDRRSGPAARAASPAPSPARLRPCSRS